MGILGALFDFSFTEFLTAQLVKFLYALTVIGVGLAYIVVVLGSFGQGAGQGLLALVGGGIVALLALAYVRVVLEFVMVLFQIYENTCIIAEHGTVTPAQASPLPASAPLTVSRQRASVSYGPLMKPLSDEDERRPFPT